MRVSTGYRFDFFSQMVSKTEASYVDSQRRITTGKQVEQPSDNPAGAAVAVKARNLRASLDQYATNITTAKSFLTFSDTNLGSVNDLLNQANSIALKGANATNSTDALKAMATQIQTLQDNLVGYANTQAPDGQYIFAGQSTKTKPYAVSNGKLVYSGDKNDVTAEFDPGRTMTVNAKTSPLFEDIYAALESLKNNLNQGQIQSISANSLKDIQNSTSSVGSIRSDLGSKLQAISEASNSQSRRKIDLTSTISDVEDVDMSKAITDYQQASTAYQAALQVAGQGYKLSLMDFIR